MSSILSYLEPEQLIDITYDHTLNRVFETEQALSNVLPQLEEKGFKENVYIYINPLVLFWNKKLQVALKQLLAEGFHVRLFKTIDPERLIQTPRFDVPNMPEGVEEGAENDFNTKAWWRRQRGNIIGLLTSNMFPESYRAIRGKDEHRSLEVIMKFRNSLMRIEKDPYKFVDREAYPGLDLPYTTEVSHEVDCYMPDVRFI